MVPLTGQGLLHPGSPFSPSHCGSSDGPRKDPEEDRTTDDSPSYPTLSYSAPEASTCDRAFQKALPVLVYLHPSKQNTMILQLLSLETVC